MAGGPCEASWLAYENEGSGGKYQKGKLRFLLASILLRDTCAAESLLTDAWLGDGINWGDTTGTGVDDYVWFDKNGDVYVFLNKNTKEQSDYYATPAWSTPKKLATGLDWRGLHVGDWDGDGKADIIGVTDRRTGSLRVWHSRWDGSEFNWEMRDISDSAKCSQGWGQLYYDHGAHFADIT